MQYKANTPEFPIVVKGDQAVQYVKVVEVLDLLGRLDLLVQHPFCNFPEH